MQFDEMEYVGFWARLFASILDTILLLVAAWIIFWLSWSFGVFKGQYQPLGNLITWLIYPAVVVMYWVSKRATTGKMAIASIVVDADTGERLTTQQAIVRYIAYYVSFLPFCLGVIWVAFDSRKQGWHDKIAGTVVVKRRHNRT